MGFDVNLVKTIVTISTAKCKTFLWFTTSITNKDKDEGGERGILDRYRDFSLICTRTFYLTSRLLSTGPECSRGVDSLRFNCY